ncbi:Rv1733c family protein [Streptomyces sp. P6-2-1]|uniref:Rv1733c family protein n=1 Tax=unclassified Streptomyces TaxID=2593676 RepID=UPI003D362F77
MRAVFGLWAWRHNPLWRTSDRVEGWAGLTTVVLLLVLVPFAGAQAALHTRTALLRTVEEQRHDRVRVSATVLSPERGTRFDTDPETGPGRVGEVRVRAAWTGPDGVRRTGLANATLSAPRKGDTFPVWTDARGRLMPRPLDAASADAHALLAGVGAGTAAVVLLEGGRRVLVWRLRRARLVAWEREWRRTGPDWGRAGTGS